MTQNYPDQYLGGVYKTQEIGYIFTELELRNLRLRL